VKERSFKSAVLRINMNLRCGKLPGGMESHGMVKYRVLRWCLKQLSDGEVLMATGIWFQVCGAMEQHDG